MARRNLTDIAIRKAKSAPAGKRYHLWDATVPGLALRVTDKGHKSFVVVARVNGKWARQTLGEYSADALPLAKAREEALDKLAAMRRGVDPREEAKRAEREAARLNADTFAAVAENFIERHAKKANRSWRETRRILLGTTGLSERSKPWPNAFAQHWGERPIRSITRLDIAGHLDTIEDQNGPVMADRALAAVRKMFNWHASRDDTFSSPIVRGMARTNSTERERERILTDNEIRAVWAACDRHSVPAYGALVRFLLLTAQRRGEAGEMRRPEIADGVTIREDLPPQDGVWTIPAARYKTKLAHLVPLTAPARAILDELHAVTLENGEKSELYFTQGGASPLSNFDENKDELQRLSGTSGWTHHDLRRTAETIMTRNGVDEFIADRVTGHKIPGVKRRYNRHDYFMEKRRALETLAGAINRILNPPGANVVPLARSAPSG